MLGREARLKWIEARKAESQYNTRLRSVVRQVGEIVKSMAPGGVPIDIAALLKVLNDYSILIKPWAESVASYMVADVARRNERVWKKHAKEMGLQLRGELATSPHGVVYRQLMDEQVTLIQSIPTEAGQRVHKLTREALFESKRAEEVSKEIMRTEQVTQSRARLIARTEVSRTASNLVQARAMAAGSEGYIWRTVGDADVRETHQEMEGKYVRWDSPPKTDKGLAPYHAGCGPNCRCFAEPVLPDL